MKKTLLSFLILFCLQFSPAKAQWVTIPDANFVIWLQTNYPTCMNGNLMDTTCSDIIYDNYVNLYNLNISDLSGIEYFNNLIDLDCSYNQLTSLPILPNGLTNLSFHFNQISNISSLPDSLWYLNCSFNSLTNLPVNLPNNLHDLICSNNQLSTLPNLPITLDGLFCQSNQLSNLPTSFHYTVKLLQQPFIKSSKPSKFIRLFCMFTKSIIKSSKFT